MTPQRQARDFSPSKDKTPNPHGPQKEMHTHSERSLSCLKTYIIYLYMFTKGFYPRQSQFFTFLHKWVRKHGHRACFLQIKDINEKHYFKRFRKFQYIIQKGTLDIYFNTYQINTAYYKKEFQYYTSKFFNRQTSAATTWDPNCPFQY